MDTIMHPLSTLRRFFAYIIKFKLRWLLIALIFIGCLVVVAFMKAERQQKAVKSIRSMGGQVYYDYEMGGPEGMWLGDDFGQRPPPPFLSKYIGIDYIHTVKCVFCEGEKINNGIAEPLQALTKLKRVAFIDTKIDDQVLQSLRCESYLQCLSLNGTPIGDDGLYYLSNFNQLQTLDLPNTSISDKGIGFLEKIPKLDDLILDGTNISDNCLKSVRKMTQLKALSLRATNITDVGLMELKALGQLKYLNIEKTKTTEQGIKQLHDDLPNLTIKK